MKRRHGDNDLAVLHASPLTRLNSRHSARYFFLLRRDLNSVVVTLGGDQQSLGVELDGVRLFGTPQARAGLADDPQGLAVAEFSLRQR
jgi:hypothetical protein